MERIGISELGEFVLVVISATMIIGYLLSLVFPALKRWFGLDSSES